MPRAETGARLLPLKVVRDGLMLNGAARHNRQGNKYNRYSITSSARASTLDGTVTPIAGLYFLIGSHDLGNNRLR